MVVTSQRRRHSRWRMFLVFVIVLGLVRHCEPMPTSKLTDTSSSSSSTSLSEGSSSSRRNPGLSSPSELAWQAWLLLDAQTGHHSSLDSASLLRRITPKSVFIAPALPACADGYRADTMGRCVKIININQEAHIDFLLQRLNAMYGNRDRNTGENDSSNSKNDQKKSSGPLQLNIPLISDSSEKLEHEETRDSMEIPVVVPPQGGLHSSEKKEPQETIVTVYELKNDTTPEESENMFFLGNTSAPVIHKDDQESSSKPDGVVPVADFVDDANETRFSEVVDYKIPIDLKTLLNVSKKVINTSDEVVVGKNEFQSSTSTEMSPTLVLLLSPTKLPNMPAVPIVDDLQLDRNNTHGQLIVQMTNLTETSTGKEIISVSVPESMIPPLKKLSEVPLLLVDKNENNETQDEAPSEHQIPVVGDIQDVESLYDDEDVEEDYVDSTDLPDDESSEAEGGEILKHGEAGMAIPVKNIERLQLEKHRQQAQQSSEARKNNTFTKIDPLDEVYIRFNDTTQTDREEKDEAGSNVSSEVSINGDFILETTLLDVNTDRTKNNTKSSTTTRTTDIEDDDEDLKDLFEPEKEHNPEPEVVFSPQDLHGTVSTRLHGRKRTEQTKTESQPSGDPKSDELEAAPSSSESLLYDPRTEDGTVPEEDAITKIHTINERPSSNKEIIAEEETKTAISQKPFESETTTNDFKHSVSSFRSNHEFDRIPNRDRQPVRFPSEEVNSIHNQDYKQRLPYSHEDGLHSSTKSSVPIHQKSSYWWLQPGWRTDRQHIANQQTQTTASSHRQKQRPLLLRFWTSMPLLKDPSLYPTDQVPQIETAGQQHHNKRLLQVPPPRRVNFYKEMSGEDLSRLLAQKLRTPLGG